MKAICEEKELQVDKIQSNAERLARFREVRGFKDRLKEERRHEERLDALANGLANLVIDVIMFGSLAAALYFGGI